MTNVGVGAILDTSIPYISCAPAKWSQTKYPTNSGEHGHFGAHTNTTVKTATHSRPTYYSERLFRMLDVDVVNLALQFENLLGLNLYVGSLTLDMHRGRWSHS